MGQQKKLRFLLCKPGSDMHWRGVHVLINYLRNAGIEIILIGNVTPQQIYQAALQEDPDVIGISVGCESVLRYMPEIMDLLQGLNKPVIVGGNIYETMVPWLMDLKVDKAFLPQIPTSQIVDYIRAFSGK